MDVISIPDVSFVSFGTSQSNSMYENNKFLFDDECSTDDYYFGCLKEKSNFDVSDNVMYINGNTYQSTKKLAVYSGYYMIKNVPPSNPIAFLSTDNSNNMTYNGLDFTKETLTVDGESVDFFSGNVVLGIFGDFGSDLKIYMKKSDGTFNTITYITQIIVFMNLQQKTYHLSLNV